MPVEKRPRTNHTATLNPAMVNISGVSANWSVIEVTESAMVRTGVRIISIQSKDNA